MQKLVGFFIFCFDYLFWINDVICLIYNVKMLELLKLLVKKKMLGGIER